MTRTKRKRLFLEKDPPKPGDLVLLKRGHAFRTLPQGKGGLVRYSREDEVALLIGFDHFLEDALLLSLGSYTMGWYDVREYTIVP